MGGGPSARVLKPKQDEVMPLVAAATVAQLRASSPSGRSSVESALHVVLHPELGK